MPPVPKKPVALDHVAVGVQRVADVSAFVVGTLGGQPAYGGPGPGYRFWQWSFAAGAKLEILEPDGPPDGFMQRFLGSRGPGIHHVTFKVPCIEDAIERAASLGYEIVGRRTESPGWKEAFLHPKQAQGIVVQLAESNPEPQHDDIPRLPFPPAPANPPEPVGLVGVRLSARAAERARRQWAGVLLGSCEEREGELVFRWSDSPLRIAVRLDAAAPEGPLGLEIAPSANRALPEGPHPVLGTSFLPAWE